MPSKTLDCGEVSGDFLGAIKVLSERYTGDEYTLFGQDLKHLKENPSRFRWSELALIYRRLDSVRPADVSLEDIGASMVNSPALGALLRTLSAVVSPTSLYIRTSMLALRRMFSHLVAQISVQDGRVIIEITLPKSYEDSPEFFRLATGIYRSYPSLIGLPNSEVEYEIKARWARYIITPPASKTVWSVAHRLFQTTVNIVIHQPKIYSMLQEQQKQLNTQYQELILAHEKLVEAHASTEQILKVMSHEFRTPLNGVRGAISMLKEEKDPAVASQLLEALDESSRRQAKTLMDIGDLAMAYNHPLLISASDCELETLVKEAIQEQQPLAKRKKLSIEWTVTDLPKTVCIDGSRLHQLLANVLENAIKFSQSGTIRVILKAGTSDLVLNGDYLQIEIHDEGIGISQEGLTRVFELFHQEAAGVERTAQGLGIGLPLCKYIVDAMNGSISLVSELKNGTSVYISVPYTPVRTSLDSSALDGEGYEGRRALVVDDNQVNRLVLGRMLKRLGIDIEYAENGVIAVEKVSIFSFDIIFMDLEMPEMNGIDATRVIRRQGNMIPIVAVTAYVMPEDRLECVSSGMNDFLSKPINQKIIEGSVHRWIGSHTAKIH